MHLLVQIHIFMHLQLKFVEVEVKWNRFIGFTALMTSR